MTLTHRIVILFASIAGTGALPATEPFSFSSRVEQEQAAERAAEVQRVDSIRQLVSIPCRERLRNQKILQLMAEHREGRWLTQQDRFGRLTSIIDTRMRALGLGRIHKSRSHPPSPRPKWMPTSITIRTARSRHRSGLQPTISCAVT